jgi:hypothetical protein
MAVGAANHPFEPGEAAAQSLIAKGTGSTDARIKAAHAKTVGARLTDAADNFDMGLADGGVQPDGMGALQRAAKARLTGQYNSQLSTQTYQRNMESRG